VTYEKSWHWFCGVGSKKCELWPGQIGIQTAAASEDETDLFDTYLLMRMDYGWGQIWKDLGLIGRPEDAIDLRMLVNPRMPGSQRIPGNRRIPGSQRILENQRIPGSQRILENQGYRETGEHWETRGYREARNAGKPENSGKPADTKTGEHRETREYWENQRILENLRQPLSISTAQYGPSK
jgi:hypothetical protein